MDGPRPIHIELLCGGRPGFEVATAIREVVTAEGATCHIIHLDAPREQNLYGKEDSFIPLAWNQYIVTALKNHPDLIEKFGIEQIDQVVKQFPPPIVPFDHPLAIRMAAEFATETVKKELEKHLETAKQKGADPYVAITCVPEGPTGTGVTWALMEWLPKWRVNYIRSFELAGIPVPDLFQFFLLEFVPARPDEDGNWENVRQGYMSRMRLHEKPWPYYWFRFDGAKVSAESNPVSSSIGARLMGMILTSRFAPIPPPIEGEETELSDAQDVTSDMSFVDLPQALRSIDALEEKPVEVMISAINTPTDEEGCREGGRLLNKVNEGIPLHEARRFAAKWHRHPEIAEALPELATATGHIVPRAWMLYGGMAGIALGLIGWFALPVRTVQLAVGSTGIFIVATALVSLLGSWWRRLLRRDRNIRRASQRVAAAIERAINIEMAGDLVGPNDMVTYGDWYVKYPIKPGTPQFQAFVNNGAKLSDIIAAHDPADLPTIRRSISESVQARIIASDWAQPSNNIHPKFVKLIPFGCKENLETFGVDAAVLQGFPGLNPTWEQASGGASQLSLVYLMMRSPVRKEDLAKQALYHQAFEQSSQHQKDERDPDKR